MTKKVNGRSMGAPRKPDSEKKTYGGLYPEQEQRLREIAEERGVTFAFIKREAVQFYLDGLNDVSKQTTE